MDGLIGIVVIAAIAAGVAYATWRRQQAQLAAARAIAARHGLHVDTSTTSPPPGLDFDLFDRGHSKQLRYRMWRDGEHDNVFQYRYTTGSGKDSKTHHRTGALISVPFDAPHLSIATENWWTKMKQLVGMRDIEIESPAFNERYHVRSDDERFAITLLDQEMIAFLLDPSSGQGDITFEFHGPWMLLYCDRLPLEQLPAMLQWGQATRPLLPEVLGEWYPRR